MPDGLLELRLPMPDRNHMTEQDKNLLITLTENLNHALSFGTMDSQTRNLCGYLLSQLIRCNNSNGHSKAKDAMEYQAITKIKKEGR